MSSASGNKKRSLARAHVEDLSPLLSSKEGRHEIVRRYYEELHQHQATNGDNGMTFTQRDFATRHHICEVVFSTLKGQYNKQQQEKEQEQRGREKVKEKETEQVEVTTVKGKKPRLSLQGSSEERKLTTKVAQQTHVQPPQLMKMTRQRFHQQPLPPAPLPSPVPSQTQSQSQPQSQSLSHSQVQRSTRSNPIVSHSASLVKETSLLARPRGIAAYWARQREAKALEEAKDKQCDQRHGTVPDQKEDREVEGEEREGEEKLIERREVPVEEEDPQHHRPELADSQSQSQSESAPLSKPNEGSSSVPSTTITTTSNVNGASSSSSSVSDSQRSNTITLPPLSLYDDICQAMDKRLPQLIQQPLDTLIVRPQFKALASKIAHDVDWSWITSLSPSLQVMLPLYQLFLLCKIITEDFVADNRNDDTQQQHLSPSPMIGKLWHAHLLRVGKYVEMHNVLALKQMIDHIPEEEEEVGDSNSSSSSSNGTNHHKEKMKLARLQTFMDYMMFLIPSLGEAKLHGMTGTSMSSTVAHSSFSATSSSSSQGNVTTATNSRMKETSTVAVNTDYIVDVSTSVVTSMAIATTDTVRSQEEGSANMLLSSHKRRSDNGTSVSVTSKGGASGYRSFTAPFKGIHATAALSDGDSDIDIPSSSSLLPNASNRGSRLRLTRYRETLTHKTNSAGIATISTAVVASASDNLSHATSEVEVVTRKGDPSLLLVQRNTSTASPSSPSPLVSTSAPSSSAILLQTAQLVPKATPTAEVETQRPPMILNSSSTVNSSLTTTTTSVSIPNNTSFSSQQQQPPPSSKSFLVNIKNKLYEFRSRKEISFRITATTKFGKLFEAYINALIDEEEERRRQGDTEDPTTTTDSSMGLMESTLSTSAEGMLKVRKIPTVEKYFFIFNHQRITSDQTPYEVQMKEGDMIFAYRLKDKLMMNFINCHNIILPIKFYYNQSLINAMNTYIECMKLEGKRLSFWYKDQVISAEGKETPAELDMEKEDHILVKEIVDENETINVENEGLIVDNSRSLQACS